MSEPYLGLLIGAAPDLLPLFESRSQDLQWLVEHVAGLSLGLALLESRKFDLVLVEDSPSNQGVDPVSAIRDAQPGVPVILIGPEPNSAGVIGAIRQNAYSYFSRPFAPRTVRDMMDTAVRTPPCDDCIRVVSALPEFLSLKIRCTLSTADRLLQFMDEMHSGLDASERSSVGLAFREILINAIEHGGNLNPDKWVHVSRIRTARALVYHMVDPGPGFSRSALDHAAISHPDASPMAHLEVRNRSGLRMGGFGILMAKKLVDEVIYSEQGNEVILVKRLD